MKKILFIAICSIASITTKAQTNLPSITDTTVFVAVQQPAEFPGGSGKLKNTINKSFRYPENARINNIQGKIPVMFVIEKDGSVSHAKVLKSMTADTDAEAIRVVSKLPKFKPAMQNGLPVRFEYVVEVSFYLAN
ncbi:energy transducer TonB [Mucilaginibacter sp.]|uniref:energy transducer TonB n=1 Tax=Mucilaginibacter sp. TaxID=1882438 RepID=UPI0026384E32|nr:energy transducer TonB [Mucilaginibacter sp.]MDB5128890.1 TonB-dependent receptor [Mucilaginibacter sp.]